MLYRFELTDGRVLCIMTDHAASNYSISHEQQSTLESSGIESPAQSNHKAYMAHGILIALGQFMSCYGVLELTKS